MTLFIGGTFSFSINADECKQQSSLTVGLFSNLLAASRDNIRSQIVRLLSAGGVVQPRPQLLLLSSCPLPPSNHLRHQHHLHKGCPPFKKVQFFWTLFKRPLTPPPFYLNICPILQGVFFKTRFCREWKFDIMYLFHPKFHHQCLKSPFSCKFHVVKWPPEHTTISDIIFEHGLTPPPVWTMFKKTALFSRDGFP